jgi:ribokinase
MRAPRICVICASNMDLVSYAPRLPKLGETLPATRFATGFGGKGANQAVMAARLGGAVSMVAKVGRDSFGEDMLRNFREQGIDTTYIAVDSEAASGVAPIWVEEGSGANAILVALGANDRLAPADVEAARSVIEAAQVVVCQWECPLDAMLTALRIGQEAGALTIFNPAPARGELPAEAYAAIDILCPNESETEILTKQTVADAAQAEAAARTLLGFGARYVILTLGERGSLLVSGQEQEFIPAAPVQAVDTTGAGDAYVGSLAYFLGAGAPLVEAMRRANAIAGISVQAPGTQSSFPHRTALPPELVSTDFGDATAFDSVSDGAPYSRTQSKAQSKEETPCTKDA